MTRRRRHIQQRRHRPSSVLAEVAAVTFGHRDVKPDNIDLEHERAAWRAVWSVP